MSMDSSSVHLDDFDFLLLSSVGALALIRVADDLTGGF